MRKSSIVAFVISVILISILFIPLYSDSDKTIVGKVIAYGEKDNYNNANSLIIISLSILALSIIFIIFESVNVNYRRKVESGELDEVVERSNEVRKKLGL
jgi:hypothetical protein